MAETLAPVLWRRRIKKERMAPSALLHHQVHILQLQWRRPAHSIHPLQLAVANGRFTGKKIQSESTARFNKIDHQACYQERSIRSSVLLTL